MGKDTIVLPEGSERILEHVRTKGKTKNVSQTEVRAQYVCPCGKSHIEQGGNKNHALKLVVRTIVNRGCADHVLSAIAAQAVNAEVGA